MVTTTQRTGLSGRLAALPGGLTVLAMTAVMALDTSDQSSIGATAPQVRRAFGVSQTQIGLLATSSTLVGVLFTLPFGVLADRTMRIRLLRGTVVLWTFAMFAVGASPSFGFMLVAHSVLGLVTGAAGPLIASVVGDLVPSEDRGKVYSALLIGELAGSALGLAVSGEVAALVGWRYAFWFLDVAGLAVLTLLSRAVEPRRRGVELVPGLDDAGLGTSVAASIGEQNLAQALRSLLRIRTNVLLVLASALGYYFFAGVQTFAVSLLHEAYGAPESVAPLLVLLVGLSLAVGVLIGGPAADRLLERGGRTGRLPLVLIAFAGSLLFVVPALASSQVLLTMPLLIVGGVLLGSANPALDATRIDIVPALLLGRAEALRTAVRDGADAVGPVLFGAFGARIGLRKTFLVMTASLGLAFALGLFATRSFPRDTERLS